MSSNISGNLNDRFEELLSIESPAFEPRGDFVGFVPVDEQERVKAFTKAPYGPGVYCCEGTGDLGAMRAMAIATVLSKSVQSKVACVDVNIDRKLWDLLTDANRNFLNAAYQIVAEDQMSKSKAVFDVTLGFAVREILTHCSEMRDVQAIRCELRILGEKQVIIVVRDPRCISLKSGV